VELNEGIYDPDSLGSITIEVGKITCGNDFTSSNTPYAIAVNNSCPTCSLENQLGSFVAPVTSGRDRSNYIKMPTVTELEEIALSNQTAGTGRTGTENRETVAYPNPTSDFLQIAATEELQQVILLDQSGAEVKEFDPLNKLFDLREVASGIYTLILTYTNYETTHIKVVKL
ncbi:T9SS type A sorting domain-containing protein, partial [Fluviicola sp.]|jgi:hypothetical protein|uniref:T9SS type A sorting domain-containing protein n=1 Tax=Fluviicola sp. TaxID=1917219 RepID=UPI00282735C9